MFDRLLRPFARPITSVFPLLLFLVVASDLTAGSNHARITGSVVDKHLQKPLSDVQVYIESLRRGDVTNQNGRFNINRLPPGVYDLVFRIQGFETFHKSAVLVSASETVEIDVEMVATVLQFDELLVTANRRTSLQHEVSQQVSLVTEGEIQDKNVLQTSEALREEAGIVIQKTNQGGGSPIIRGLKANKLLLMVDGIRLNNATYRGGNLQYLNSVDASALQRIEVVHGPNSVLYGSDALGGVVNVITRKASLVHGEGNHYTGSGSISLSSADRTQTGNFNVRASNSTLGVGLAASYKSFGNITRGSSGGGTLSRRLENDSRADRILRKTQSPNDYDSVDFNSNLVVKLTDFQQLTAAYQLSRQKSVPRYDVFEVQQDSVFRYAPQERDLAYVRYRNSLGNSLFNSATITVSVQRQFERRVRQKFGSTQETSDQFRTVTTGLQLQFNKVVAQKHQLVYGSEIFHDRVATKSFQRDTNTHAIGDRDPIFPHGSSFINFGLFAQDDFQPAPKWHVNLGARLSAFRLTAPFSAGPSGANFGAVEQTPTALTGSIGSLVEISSGFNFVTNLSQGFRAPNLDDVTKLGAGKAGFFDVPNPDVKPEKSISFDAGFKLRRRGWNASVVGYYNRITDLLLRRPSQFNGQIFVIEGADTLAVFRKENAGRAFTAGFGASANVVVTPKTNLFGQLSFTRGQNLSEDEPLSAIPPLNGLVGARFKLKRYHLEINGRFAVKQEHLSFEDTRDLRIPEGGTPAWYTLNVRLRSDINKNLTLNLAVSNLLDRHYREHLSGFSAAGRNFIVGMRGSF